MGSDDFANLPMKLVLPSLTLSMPYKSLLQTILSYYLCTAWKTSMILPDLDSRPPASWLCQGQLLCPWTDGLSSIASIAPMYWG